MSRTDESIRVLHVDDEPDFVDVAATFLEREDDRLTVETATSASEGLERLAGEAFDCIVSDYDMPEQNGIEFLEAVRENVPDLPFILYTGKGSEEVASEAISAGVDEYLQKANGTDQYAILANRITNLVAGSRSQRALSERRRRLETLIDNLPGIVYRCRNEPGWPMEYIEGECEKLTGYAPSTIERGAVSFGADIVHPEDRDAVRETVQSALEANEPFETTYRIIAGDGTEKWVWERGREIRSAGVEGEGEIAALEGFITDITKRKEMEKELREKSHLLDQLFEQIPIHLYVKDREGHYLYLSEYLVNEADTLPDAEEQIGETILDIYPEEFARDVYEDERTVIETGEPVVDKEEFEPREGEWNLTTKVPWRGEDGDVKGLIGVTQQITERKEYEQELERQNERLDKFTRVVSHDLRNPLNVAAGGLDIAREECDSDHLETVAQAHERMETLIDDLLTLAREGESVEETEYIDLAGFTERCWQTVGTAKATLVVETDRTIRADPDRLQQLLENLIRNAVDHGGEDVTITIGDLDNGSGFYLADDGPGIPEEEREHIFVSGYSTATEGTGFGLGIVEEIVAAHGWEVSVTDSDHGGARFEIGGVATDE